MSEKYNGTCAICGKKYEVCVTCRNVVSFKPWRTITDTMECFKIYDIIRDYSLNKITKEVAKERLERREIPDELQEHIKAVIDEIMAEEKKETPALSKETLGKNKQYNFNNQHKK